MGVTPQAARAAVDAGERVKLLCEAVREGDIVRASVRPVRLPLFRSVGAGQPDQQRGYA